MSEIEKLRISQAVPAEEYACDFIVPASGEVVVIKHFAAEGPYSVNSVTKLCFGDPYGPPSGNSCIWSIKGSGVMPFEFEIIAASTDGNKAIGICCENAEDGEVYMSAYAEIFIV